jgi:SulP family sulfate permease
MKVGWDIIDWGYLKRIRRAPRDKLLVMLVTLGLTVFVDLITAVAAGLILAGFVTARWMEQEELKGVTAVALAQDEGELSVAERKVMQDMNGQIGIIALRGHFSYASARELVQRIGSATSGHEAMVFDFTGAAHVDTSAALAIGELIETAEAETRGCFVDGLSGTAEETLRALGVLDKIPTERIVQTRLEAIKQAANLIKT